MASWDAGRIAPLAVGTALAAGAAVALCWLTGSDDDLDERERLLAVLKEISRRSFIMCQDVAAVAKSSRAKIYAANVAITEEKLQEQLLRQMKVMERIDQIQNEVAGQFGLTAEDIAAMHQLYPQDEEVNSYSAGLRDMVLDAVQGLNPILPNVAVPKGLTEEKALEVLREVQEAEANKVLETVGGKKCTLQELGQVLKVGHDFAWDHVLKAHTELLEGGGPEVYHSAVATYCRNEDFAKDKATMEEAHQKRMIALFRSDGKNKGLFGASDDSKA
eukprot:gb/GFBE01058550.1/.p1 GENE.gb/GFBE01058550.1/~~gb/GFBE01058550.1/.p1  ORF type:complete len:275 (+),score=63.46 gb/GFBE01058550.1/:1-825(+)